ncbi:MAG TPA: hypothetical protein PK916_13115 [Bacteroidota bacterium]|nr:hypothetical protein [Bacteroidota bacterium]
MTKGRFSLLLLLFAALTMQGLAQTTVVVRDAAEDDEDMHIKVGVMAGLGLAMNTTDYHVSNVSRSLGLGSQFGLRGSFPLGRKSRVVGGIGYHTLAFADENARISFSDAIENHSTNVPENLGKLKTEGSFKYTIITAGFQFSQFFITFSYGLPMSSTLENSLSNGTIDADGIDPAAEWSQRPDLNPDGNRIRADISPEKDDINPLLELRLGGEFPAVKTALGDLNFGISLAYTFNNIIKDGRTNLPTYEDQFHLPNVLFHLSYMFNI